MTTWNERSTTDKERLSARKRKRDDARKNAVYELYGNVCPCGSTHDLRLRFKSFSHPLRESAYRSLTILATRLLRDVALRSEIALLCEDCRYRLRLLQQTVA